MRIIMKHVAYKILLVTAAVALFVSGAFVLQGLGVEMKEWYAWLYFIIGYSLVVPFFLGLFTFAEPKEELSIKPSAKKTVSWILFISALLFVSGYLVKSYVIQGGRGEYTWIMLGVLMFAVPFLLAFLISFIPARRS